MIKASWPAPRHIKAYATTRQNGFSLAPYESLNLGLMAGDETDAVIKNRAHLESLLALPSSPCWLKQTHSNIVVKAQHSSTPPEADASFTDQANTVCAILTADCLPILLCDREGEHIAAIHAGWRGLANGIIGKTVESLPCPSELLMAWLGPAISQQAFEVGDDVYDTFMKINKGFEKAFIRTSPGHWHTDLYEIAKQQLNAYNVTDVYGGEYCTFTDKKCFFSYRRDGLTGRIATLIWKNKSTEQPYLNFL